MSKDLYTRANEIFHSAFKEGELQDFIRQIGEEEWLISLEMFERKDQKRLIDLSDVFETSKVFIEILRRLPEFKGLESSAFRNVGFELWQIYKTTPRSYEELSRRTRDVQKEFARLSKYNLALEGGANIYESERKLKEAQRKRRSFVRRALDWVLMYIPGLSAGAIRRITNDDLRKWRAQDAKTKLKSDEEALSQHPILKHAYDVDVQILLAEFPTRALNEIKALGNKA